ncbi:CATRA system-associated protein [Amycolatopsis cihanbeyliensis]|uniref:CobQ/CobB/MinD/ParA family nucleotide binding protein n=1 Tax=Amycolatopsis cihanbeyliensis TaxID=1128664 RepID=A0A542DH63_AMYCI|nr:CATRA system-associated protein [Amycolatopsis cihanbeyliensis]TQJ02438.1 CobQ/CobB/MinD/ParA family nucleotide binding protein [Amycolatopsis cihanbeyliensis]
MTGTVVTFYSYKGGVGRSFALANVAVLLARWGYRVLAIDWDLEAPGLHHYFAPVLPKAPDGGVVDLAYDFLAGASEPAERAIRLGIEDGAVALLAAGRQDETYTRRVQGIDWDDLYEHKFATFLERCRAEWTASYDFVLIDSRTGISDIGGICTAHLPDRLAVVFTANQQSVDGAVNMARLADLARDRLPYDRAVHLVLPILSRLDNRVEYERAESWQRRCAETVAPLFSNWLAQSVPEDVMLRHLTLPYVSYWSFGEQLPVLEERAPSADQISFALETVASVIAQQFDRTDLLADNRDAYVASARTQERAYELDLLVSSPRSVLDTATEFIDELGALGVRAHRALSGAPGFLDRKTDTARHLCLIVDKEVSRWQVTEADRFLRHTLDADGDRRLFCVLTRDTDRERLPGFLRNLRHLHLDTGVRTRQVAQQLHELLTDAPQGRADSTGTALREAAAALRNVPGEVAHRGRWALIEQTVRDMTVALDDGDLALFRDLTVDLEQLNEVRGNSDRFVAPDGLRSRIGALIERLDRRINVYPK